MVVRRDLWGGRLQAEMQRCNHAVGLKVVGEMPPQERNAVTLADDKDQHGPPVARVTCSWCDNDRRMIGHALGFMGQALKAAGVTETRRQEDDICHTNGGVHGRRPARQRRGRGLPLLESMQPVALRRRGVPD